MKAALTILTAFSLSISALAQISPTEASLRTAIASGGSITFNSSGTISITTPFTVAVDTTIDGTNQNITIDGQALTRLFEVNSGIHFTIKNLVLANGLAKGIDANNNPSGPTPGYGGALKTSGGLITVANCIFTNNAAVGGAGAYNPLIPGRPLSNSAEGAGGSIWQTGGSLNVQGGAFLMSAARAGGPSTGPQRAIGGAIFAAEALVIIDGVAFSSNAAQGAGARFGGSSTEGGAVYVLDSTTAIQNTQFFTNSAAAGDISTALGGAISAEGSSSVALSNSEFAANGVTGGGEDSFGLSKAFPGYGGAIYVGTNATVSIRESVLHDNVAAGGQGFHFENGSGFGGAIYVDGVLGLVNATLVNNLAAQGSFHAYPSPPSDGGAIFSNGSVGATNITVISNSATTSALAAASGSFVIKNSLFGKNFGATASAGITDAGNNLSSSDTPVFTDASSHQVASIKVGPFGNYGGPTPIMPLLAGSPAIDAGDDSSAPAIDQRGRTRPFGAHSDVGAFESSPPFYIFGKVIGYRNASQSAMLAAQTVQPDSTGAFLFQAPQGNASIAFAGTNTVFRPNPLVIDVQADMETHATAFELQALANDPEADSPTFSFGGSAGETWAFDVSNDLINWTPVHTNTFAIEGVYSMPLTNVAFPVFMKGVKK